jgi:hypothetical protein
MTAPMIQRSGRRNPRKNRILWLFFHVRTPAETKQANQRRPNSPPHKYQALTAKGILLLLR